MGTRPEALKLVVLTGAGISAASGMATYRQAGSGWSDPRLEAMSKSTVFGNYLRQLWPFWATVTGAAQSASPNPAHLALTAAQDRLEEAGGWLRVITQNVDGLHAAAGTRDVLELHGNIRTSRCMRTGCVTSVATPSSVPADTFPRCQVCGRGLRPNVVLFGERLSSRVMREAEAAARAADVCVVVGTSGIVHPAVGLVATAATAGARCVLVNAEQWAEGVSVFDDVRLGPAEVLLPVLLAELAPSLTSRS